MNAEIQKLSNRISPFFSLSFVLTSYLAIISLHKCNILAQFSPLLALSISLVGCCLRVRPSRVSAALLTTVTPHFCWFVISC